MPSAETLICAATTLHFVAGIATAQSAATSGNQLLSLDQQSKISEIIADQTAQPADQFHFFGRVRRCRRLEAEILAPQLHGYSYLAVEGLVAVVDTNSRKIISVMQRMRRQEDSKWVWTAGCTVAVSTGARPPGDGGRRHSPPRCNNNNS